MLPLLAGGGGGGKQERFDDIEQVIKRVRELHEIADPDVTPHKSKYAARVIMVRRRKHAFEPMRLRV